MVPSHGSAAREFDRLEDQYVVAAALIVASICVYAIVGDHVIGRLSVVVVQAVTLLVILRASGASARAVRIALVLGSLGIVLTGFATLIDRESVGPAIIGAMLAFVGPVVIVRRLLTHLRIDVATIAGSLCIYLLGGLFFAYIYRVIEIADGPFFVQRHHINPVDFVYFSFVTLTTLGYGDLTPYGDLSRMLAISEALFGQLYLVSVVALLVGNIGQARRSVSDDRDDPTA